MKILHVQNIDASDVLTEVVQLPPQSELQIAGILGADGMPITGFWYEPKLAFYSGNQDQFRNRASVDKYTKALLTGVTPKHIIDESLQAANTFATYFPVERKKDGAWTIATVCRVSSTLADNANTSVFGFDLGATGANAPVLNIQKNGTIRCFGGLGHTPATLIATGAAAGIDTTFKLIVLSQSEENGCTLRVNGVEITKNTGAAAKTRSTAKKIRFLGSDVSSAALNGYAGTTFLLDADISTDPIALGKVEGYLKAKYGIA